MISDVRFPSSLKLSSKTVNFLRGIQLERASDSLLYRIALVY